MIYGNTHDSDLSAADMNVFPDVMCVCVYVVCVCVFVFGTPGVASRVRRARISHH